MTIEGEKFPRSARLTRKKDFTRIITKGSKIKGEHFDMYYRKGDTTLEIRLGLIVSKKVGISVVRNKIKRRTREIFRKNRKYMIPGLDLVVRIKPSCVNITFQRMEKLFLDSLKQSDLMNMAEMNS